MMIGCIGNHSHKGTEDSNICVNVLGTVKTAFVSCQNVRCRATQGTHWMKT
jgi:hypothetical protein